MLVTLQERGGGRECPGRSLVHSYSLVTSAVNESARAPRRHDERREWKTVVAASRSNAADPFTRLAINGANGTLERCHSLEEGRPSSATAEEVTVELENLFEKVGPTYLRHPFLLNA